jgi:hypothetical protein
VVDILFFCDGWRAGGWGVPGAEDLQVWFAILGFDFSLEETGLRVLGSGFVCGVGVPDFFFFFDTEAVLAMGLAWRGNGKHEVSSRY